LCILEFSISFSFMDTPQTNNRTAIFIVILICSVIGAAASYLSYRIGFNNAKDIVQKSSFGSAFRIVEDVRALSGSVIAINGDRLTLRTPSVNPFDLEAITERTVLINSDTQIFTLSGQASKGVPPATTPDATVSPTGGFTRVTVEASSIAVNDMVTVIASENVKDRKEFTATSIQLTARKATSSVAQ